MAYKPKKKDYGEPELLHHMRLMVDYIPDRPEHCLFSSRNVYDANNFSWVCEFDGSGCRDPHNNCRYLKEEKRNA